jgi:hypothetical protein
VDVSDSAINKAFVICTLILAQAVLCLLCIGLGQWLAIDKARMAAAEILLRPRPTIPQPAFLIKCDSRGREEFFRSCRQRARAGEIK